MIRHVDKPCIQDVSRYLLVPAQDISDGGAAGEGLVDLHGRPSWVCKYSADTLALQRLHQNVCSLARLSPIPVLPLNRA